MKTAAQTQRIDFLAMLEDWREETAETEAAAQFHAAMRTAHDRLFSFAQALREIDEREESRT